jgi:hypothetical protein
MARLTAAKRRRLPKKDFAGRGESYPVDTRGRAIVAKGRARQAVKAGRMSRSEEKHIDAMANRKLGKSRSGKRKMGRTSRRQYRR